MYIHMGMNAYTPILKFIGRHKNVTLEHMCTCVFGCDHVCVYAIFYVIVYVYPNICEYLILDVSACAVKESVCAWGEKRVCLGE